MNLLWIANAVAPVPAGMEPILQQLAVATVTVSLLFVLRYLSHRKNYQL